MRIPREFVGLGILICALFFCLIGLAFNGNGTFKVHAMFRPGVSGCNGDLVMRSGADAGSRSVVFHETLHILRQCGKIGRDVPTAAAAGSCASDRGISSLRDPLELVFIRTSIARRLKRAVFGNAKSEADASHEVDSLVHNDNRYSEEFPGSYRRGAQIAATALAHLVLQLHQ